MNTNTIKKEDDFSLKGEMSWTLTNPEGEVLQGGKQNLIVSAGRNFAANALIASSTSPFTHIAVGIGTTAANLTNTTLESEVARVAFTSATAVGNLVTIQAVFGAGVGTGAITEAGILNAATFGTLLSRVVFSAINKQVSDTLTITWTITVS